MKKLISVLMVLALCLSLVPAALAAETESVITWEEVEALIAEEGWEGGFVELPEVGLKIWVPSVLGPVELTQEDVEASYIAYFITEDGSAALGITLYEAGMTEDEVLAYLLESGCEDAEIAVINGTNFITYTNVTDEGVVCNVATLVSEDGYALEFAFSAGDEDFEIVSAAMVSSIQPIE
ncbi:MAG: hypothetical protein ACI3XG_03945 [Faecousia sp.]